MVKKIGKKIVADLKKRSEKGLELAKQIMQKEKIEDLTLREALTHYLTNWNDFTHSGLFSLACEAVGGKTDDTISAQAAIAMMAAAFDIHDDIIDKSETKHKTPTVYGKFGPEVALLLGNAFLIEGLKLLVNSAEVLPRQKARWLLETVKELTFEVGNAHAIEAGLKKRKNIVPEEYMHVIEMKAAGIELDMTLGALFGGGKKSEIDLISRLGRIIGILVMIREEFIDIFEIEELRHRIRTNNLPLPVLFAMQNDKVRIKITGIIKNSRITQTDSAKILNITFASEPVIKLKQKMNDLVTDGHQVSKYILNTEARTQFQQLLSFMLEDL
ncbi:MAG: polyprenyl synthetase family protein [Candidatus Bathyarchaeales archaeon]